ncbi:MAG TPA: 30S ribosomal protein S12 methylthiotransferase RimO [Eggerthellaceae bacterium]|nr:30S ribosomal protein S12 methylthiotransferase RimO [Eggerthellaceae bacterium]
MGCAKNEVDSDHMSLRLRRAGYDIVADPEHADVVVVNTCSFIQAATEESIEAILEAAGFESIASGNAHLVVAGCMPARYGGELHEALPEVRDFITCSEEQLIVQRIDEVLGIERLPGNAGAVDLGSGAATSDARTFAYVKISDGCDRFCSYCTIPSIRGRYHSFSENQIAAEVQRNVDLGAREIVLIAQDTGRWGSDLRPASTLAVLVDHLAERFPDTWFRIMYIQPSGISDELVGVVARRGNVCSYFDIPFQHANGRILKAMNRSGSGERHLQLVRSIRERIPDCTVRTTLIAGFPGETDEDFEELCAFVEEAELDYVGVFAYSREEGTRAYDLEGQLDEDEKAQRAQTLRDLADACCTPRIALRVGQEMDVLVCGAEEDGQLYGRAMCQAPDVDGVTYVDAGKAGDIVRVRIDDTLLYEMEGTVVA